ncbi:DUF3617 domain-containing protein [Sphingomonas canadensis]|uniref:DUF3617 domain-containing protein n=1 Tax=Sphingomonas canadensis TaxID=1219257 RepID=A0ABW3H5Q4_9SPHN|nr:DUF3617 domain-containing protein [Sphingomonas canadensis]MCW3836580.1 DUF3617 domain-containing protein [Sphingomonas canadensis]
MPRLTTFAPLIAVLALAACNQGPSVSLTNASPEEVAAKSKEAGAAPQMKPGKWETKIEVLEFEMPGTDSMPKQLAAQIKERAMKPTTISSCMTEEDVKRPNFGGKDESKCKFDKYEMSNGKIEAVMSCPGEGGEMKMVTNGSFEAETFAVEQAMDVSGPMGKMHTRARVSGKRVGDCKPGEK